MKITITEYYLIAINIIGFVMYRILISVCSRKADKKPDIAALVLSFLGGSPGVLLSVILSGKKAEKENMMSRVIIYCLLVLQIIIYLITKGYYTDSITFDLYSFLARHKAFVLYLLIINIIAFSAFAIDKYNAVKKKFRIKISILLGLAFAGGSAGSLIAMYLLRHKTQKKYFSVGVPLIIITQIAVVFYIINSGL